MRALLIVAVTAIVASGGVRGLGGVAAAQDFWDDVRHPGRPAGRALGRDARHALANGEAEAALALSVRALAYAPDAPELHVLSGRALSALSRYAQASDAFERGLAISETALDGLTDGQVAVSAACRAGRFPVAARILARLVSHIPPGPTRRRLLATQGDVLMTLGPSRLPQAIAAYGYAMRDPGGRPERDLPLLLGLALALHRSGQPGEARALLRGSARIGRLEDAIADLALPRSEREARLAVALEAIGDPNAAGIAWRRARAEGPWQHRDGDGSDGDGSGDGSGDGKDGAGGEVGHGRGDGRGTGR